MVQGIDIVQIDIAFLTYNPDINANEPSVKIDSSCIAGLYELKKHREHKRRHKKEMGADAYKHYKWYNLMLRTELISAGQQAKLKIIHWHIESGNVAAFKVNNLVYKAVSIIIGPEMEHYYCANTGRNPENIYGSRLRKGNLSHSPIATLSSTLSNNATKSDSSKKSKHECSRQNYHKCTMDYCSKNCNRCTKYVSPFSKPKNIRCACYIEKTFEKIIEENENDVLFDEKDAVILYSYPLKNNSKLKYNNSQILEDIKEE